MAFDASMLICLSREIDALRESRIEKIYQPSGDEIVIMLHSAKEILISEIVLSQSVSYEDVEARIVTALA